MKSENYWFKTAIIEVKGREYYVWDYGNGDFKIIPSGSNEPLKKCDIRYSTAIGTYKDIVL